LIGSPKKPIFLDLAPAGAEAVADRTTQRNFTTESPDR
jgi:hypothetical protein